ncbi:MAG: hypothetical protein QXF26_06945 [Candidatus Bathyarchaeia archaeon]
MLFDYWEHIGGIFLDGGDENPKYVFGLRGDDLVIAAAEFVNNSVFLPIDRSTLFGLGPWRFFKKNEN